VFGCPFNGGHQVTSLAFRENAHAIPYRRFDKRPSRGFVVFRSADECRDNPHHFESELASRTGTHHRVKAIIPAGAPIDIESCGEAWCYMAWAGHVGYVKHQYLMHHVTAEVPPLIHVTHVHKHGLINF
jgi:hypothetical protein